MRGQKRKQVLGRFKLSTLNDKTKTTAARVGICTCERLKCLAAHRKLIINDRQQPSRAHRRDRQFTL